MKLADWARLEGIHPKTAYRWFRTGQMPVPAEKVAAGSILVHDPKYNKQAADDDLVRDMVDVLTSMCARLYGRRGARNRAEKALRCAANDVGPSSETVA